MHNLMYHKILANCSETSTITYYQCQVSQELSLSEALSTELMQYPK